MEFHRGGPFDHIHIRVSNLEANKRFYLAVLNTLGHPEVLHEGPGFFYADELFVNLADDYVTRIDLAFQAPDPETVMAFHKVALNVGGNDNGKPGERSYHSGYYAEFVLDSDGNNIEAVYHGPFNRSASSVIITPE